MSEDPYLDAWLVAERAAANAELEIARMGQAAADPAMAEKLKEAAALRAEADRLFRLLPEERARKAQDAAD